MKRNTITIAFTLILITSGYANTRDNGSNSNTTEVMEYVLNSESVKSKLNELIFGPQKDSPHLFFKENSVFNMYVINDTNSLILKLSLNCCPYIDQNLLGYFVLNDYTIFIHNSIPDFLKSTNVYSTFFYNKLLDNPFNIWKTNVPFWILRYKDSEIRKTYDPIVVDDYFIESRRFYELMNR